MRNMTINIVLNMPARHPIGGYKIVFEYANRLTIRGHKVNIIYDCRNSLKKYKINKDLIILIWKLFLRTYSPWFQIDKKVQQLVVWKSTNENIPDADIIIATATITSYYVNNLSSSKGDKYYLIQHYEDWSNDDKTILDSYSMGLKNIVIAKWLQKIVDNASGKKSVLIPNGIDLDMFNVMTPVNQRKKYSLSMLYHNYEWKGAKDGIKVIYRLKEKYPDLEVSFFGVPKRPKELPSWIKYTRNANQLELGHIYNESAIYLCPSWSEGFGLTGAESMACGCALVSTDTDGVQEYAEDKVNALLSPPRELDILYNNIVKLFENDQLRISIANAGIMTINKFSWENAVSKFENTISNVK